MSDKKSDDVFGSEINRPPTAVIKTEGGDGRETKRRSETIHPLRAIFQPLIDFAKSSRAMWGINIPYLLEGFVYFGVIGYLVMYFSEYIGLHEIQSGWMVAMFTGGITISAFFFGGLANKLGTRRVLAGALVLMVLGRALLAFTPSSGLSPTGPWENLLSPLNLLAGGGLLLIVLGYGTWQPASYSAVRQLTTPKTAAMGYAMLYAFMNLGGWLPTFFSPIRKAVGIDGAFWVYAGITVVALVVLLSILTNKVMKKAVLEAREASNLEGPKTPSLDTRPDYMKSPAYQLSTGEKIIRWFKEHPMADGKFAFFIFALIPVQTLFAHNWLTLPQYVERAFRNTWVGDNFEWAVNFNPLLVFLFVPVVTALTRNKGIYTMMLVGTFVMAVPTFLLALGPSPAYLFGYLIIMTIGEAMWQPRFLQYAAEIAPEGKTGAYMGVAQLPWFMTKIITGLYSGYFIATYCPEEGALNTEFMWMVYGIIALSSFFLLLLAKKWMTTGDGQYSINPPPPA